MIQPGLYCDAEGILAIAHGRDGEVVAVRIPLDLAGMEDAARKILGAVSAMRQAQRQAVAGGEKPRLIELRRGAAWN